MTDHAELIARLREACNGHPYAKIAWPHRILHEAADAISSLVRERDEARARVSSGSDYSIQLQRIIEALCHGFNLREDSAELFHHKMVMQKFPDYQTLRARATAAEADATRMREALSEAKCALWTDLNVTDEELLRIRNVSPYHDVLVAIGFARVKMLQKIVDAVRIARNALGGKDE